MKPFTLKRSGACAAVLLILGTAPAWACRAPPLRLSMSVDEQIAEAPDVSVARVVDAVPLEDGNVEYRFIVQQRLAGPDRFTFKVTGRRRVDAGPDTSYARHTVPSFWDHGGGRLEHDMGVDCQLHPSFAVGDSYLVFLGAPAVRRSFERIETVDGGIDHGDQWLLYVETALKRRPPPGAGTADDARIGRFIYGFYRGVAREDLETAIGRPVERGHASAELVGRARRLADAFDHILNEQARVPEAQIDATLREAAAVGAAIRALPDSGGNAGASAVGRWRP
jgi:hypothetical protein